MSVSADVDEARRLVREFFGGDDAKTLMWFELENPLLGGVAPNTMIRLGREKKLLRFIREQLSQNEPPGSGKAGE